MPKCGSCKFFESINGAISCPICYPIPFSGCENYEPLIAGKSYTALVTDELVSETVEKALDIQVGGKHYKHFVIQPVEFCQKNKLNYCESNVVKYICRHKDKNGIEDLKKVKHYVDLLIELEYGDNTDE